MKSRIIRAGVIAAEAAGLAVAALAALAAFVFWRVQAAPVDLDWASAAIRAGANSAVFSGAVREIDGVTLSKSETDQAYRLRLENVRLGRSKAPANALLPLVVIEIFPSDLFSGRAGPRRILIDGAELRILRRDDKKLKLDFGEEAGARARVFQAMTGGAYFREAFERAELRDAKIVFVDEASGRRWRGSDGAAVIYRTEGGYAAEVASNFDIGGQSASLSFRSNYDLSTRVISSNLVLVDAPVGDLVAVLFNAEAELLTSPISGAATIDLSDDGAVLSSQIDIRAAKGAIRIGDWSTEVSSLSASAAFDPRFNRFDVHRFEWDGALGAGAASGEVTLQPAASGKGVDHVAFDLWTNEFSARSAEPGAKPIRVDQGAAAGVFNVKERRIDISALSAGFLGVTLNGAVSVNATPGKSAGVTAQLQIDGALVPQSLLSVWPGNLAAGARNFVATRLATGVFSKINFEMDLAAGAIGTDGILPDDAMILSFRADGAEVIYAPGMTPLKAVSGTGVLKGNSFSFEAEGGKVGAVAITGGDVEITRLAPKGAPTYFRFRAAGEARDILSVLAQEPLAIFKKTTFAPDQFAGKAQLDVEIERPNLSVAPPDSYRYKGKATFIDLSVENIIGDASLSNGVGRLSLTTEGMTTIGEAEIGGAPVSIEWRQKFQGADDTSVILAQGVADSAMADLLGVPTRQMAQGEVPFSAKAVGDTSALRFLEIDADFTNATLVSEPLGWMKPAGVPATGAAKIEFSPERLRVASLTLSGKGIAIEGDAEFERAGSLISVNARKFSLAEAADISLAGKRDEEGVMSFAATGAYLNVSEIIRAFVEGGSGAGSSGDASIALSATLDRIDFRGGSTYKSASIDFSRAGALVEQLDFRANDARGKPLTMKLLPADAKGEQMIEARSEDVGALLAGIFGVTSVKGGAGHLDFFFTPGVHEAPRKGSLEAHDLRVKKAPILAKIFSAGSLTGLADLVNGEGIELKNAMAVFAIEEGRIRVSEARATGPSVGITAAGSLPLDGGAVDLSGSVAPAYQVNSFLGRTPVIGDLFVSRKGEGILALSYDVKGETAEPRVTVNPLSALTPGVLRRMFEGGRDEEPTDPNDPQPEPAGDY